MEKMRKAIVAGRFYTSDKTALRKEIERYVKGKGDKKVVGGVVPHAGYMFSGKCAGKVYSVLPDVETYVILGVNHTSSGGNISLSTEDFETPLGIAKNDNELGKSILEEIKIEEGNNAHKYEHSIEVQLPFLQVTHTEARIVPIILREYTLETCKKLAKAICDSAKKLKKKIIVLASSDFTHTGLAYGFNGDIKVDKKAIDAILKLDSKEFIDIAKTTTICGVGAIATAIEVVKLLGAKKGKLLEYYDSSKIIPGESKVGYAGIAFLA